MFNVTGPVWENHALFERYAPLIRALLDRERVEKSNLLVPDFRLYSDSQLQLDVYYAPFGYVNEGAKVVLLGITPGWTQMEIAYRHARQDLLNGLSATKVCHCAKKRASFAGSMRRNLITMLDGLPSLLGIPSSEALFGEYRSLLHTSSTIRYPVFVRRRNYTGHSPRILGTPALRWFIDHVLAAELQYVPRAVIIPLGKSVSEVLEYLDGEGEDERNRCLLGFPHPSGANGHRIREFTERRGRLAQQLAIQLSRDVHPSGV